MCKFFLFICTICVSYLCAETIPVSNAADLKSQISFLTPGDTMLVAAGTYDINTWGIADISGTADSWIVIKADGAAAVRSTSGCCNLVEIQNAHYVRLDGFELTMQSINPAIDGIKFSGTASSNIILENLHIHGMTANGISIFSTGTNNIALRNSEIDHCEGSGLYWGYPGRDIVSDVLIENNYIHHCPADSLLDTHYGIQWKGWCYRGIIQNNVLHDVGGTTRCGIVVYYGKTPLKGDVSADINIVRGNVLWNCRNEGITAMSDALVENNIVFDAAYGIHTQTYGDESFSGSNYVENLTVRNNTVFRCISSCITISGWDAVLAGDNVSLIGNIAYQDISSKTSFSGSVGNATLVDGNCFYGSTSLGNSSGFIQGNGLGDFAQISAAATVPGLDFYPAQSAPFVDVLDNFSPLDFNGTARPNSVRGDAGAYERASAANPGWSIQEDFKTSEVSAIPRHFKHYSAAHAGPHESGYRLYTLQGKFLQAMYRDNARSKSGDLPSGLYCAIQKKNPQCGATAIVLINKRSVR